MNSKSVPLLEIGCRIVSLTVSRRSGRAPECKEGGVPIGIRGLETTGRGRIRALQMVARRILGRRRREQIVLPSHVSIGALNVPSIRPTAVETVAIVAIVAIVAPLVVEIMAAQVVMTGAAVQVDRLP